MRTYLNKTVLFFLLFVGILFCNQPIFGQECPFGIQNCRGGCGRMIDADGDGFCDYSIKTETKDTIAETIDTIHQVSKINQNDKSSIAVITDSQNTFSITCREHLRSHFKEAFIAIPQKERKPRYQFIFYSLLTIIAYFISLLLLKLKIWSKKTHRRIWNILLLVTFFVSGILGLILVLQINYGIIPDYFMQFMQWHVDFGIGMAWISIFHVIWHFSYFKNIVRPKHQSQDCT